MLKISVETRKSTCWMTSDDIWRHLMTPLNHSVLSLFIFAVEFNPATKLCYAIGAVLGLVGGIKTYGKFSSGDPDTSKTAASWFFACIFLIVAATILRSFFL